MSKTVSYEDLKAMVKKNNPKSTLLEPSEDSETILKDCWDNILWTLQQNGMIRRGTPSVTPLQLTIGIWFDGTSSDGFYKHCKKENINADEFKNKFSSSSLIDNLETYAKIYQLNDSSASRGGAISPKDKQKFANIPKTVEDILPEFEKFTGSFSFDEQTKYRFAIELMDTRGQHASYDESFELTARRVVADLKNMTPDNFSNWVDSYEDFLEQILPDDDDRELLIDSIEENLPKIQKTPFSQSSEKSSLGQTRRPR